MDEFTKEEMHRIDMLYGTDFKDIKPEDAQLIARWEKYKATNNAEYELKKNALERETQAKIELANEKQTVAIEILKAKAAAAREKLERVRNGEH